MIPSWVYLVVAFAWLLAFRAHRKRMSARLDASVSAGSLRDLSGRGGF